MAKTAATKTNSPARLRFIMLDAELPEGSDLNQVMQTIQNALRPGNAAASAHRVVAVTAKRLGPPENPPDPIELEDQEVDELPSQEEQEQQPSVARPRGPRKIRTPKVLDLDLASDPSFETFAKTKNPASDWKRFLVVAAWFKQARQVDAITADHVYTCYRAVKWPSAIEDFSQPLRDLKRKQLLEQKGKGTYGINHLGLAEVDKLGGA